MEETTGRILRKNLDSINQQPDSSNQQPEASNQQPEPSNQNQILFDNNSKDKYVEAASPQILSIIA